MKRKTTFTGKLVSAVNKSTTHASNHVNESWIRKNIDAGSYKSFNMKNMMNVGESGKYTFFGDISNNAAIDAKFAPDKSDLDLVAKFMSNLVPHQDKDIHVVSASHRYKYTINLLTVYINDSCVGKVLNEKAAETIIDAFVKHSVNNINSAHIYTYSVQLDIAEISTLMKRCS